MTIIGQLLRLCLFLFSLIIENFVFVLINYEETSQLIYGVDHLSGFYLVHCIERNIVIFTSLLRLYLIIDRIFFVGTFLILNLLFSFCSGVCSIIPFQRCRLILRNIEGQSEFSIIPNTSIHGNIQKMFEPTFLQMYLLSEYCFLPCNIVSVTFYVIGRINLLKTQNASCCNSFDFYIIFCYMYSLMDRQLVV